MKEDVFPHVGDFLLVFDWGNTDTIADYKFPLTESLAESWGRSGLFIPRPVSESSPLRAETFSSPPAGVDWQAAPWCEVMEAVPLRRMGNLLSCVSCLLSTHAVNVLSESGA